jgi:nitroreductase
MFRDVVLKNRSYRRFFEEHEITENTLIELVDLARLSPSAKNMQPIRYMLINDREKNAEVYKHLVWAGYLKDWDGPEEGERPSGYIVMLGDKRLSNNFDWDTGISAQTILLGAVEKGLGGCMIGTLNRPKLKQLLNIAEDYDILLVLALGKPKETVVIEPVKEDGDIKYWHDAEDVHHVPKRSLEDLIIK